jgi:DnaJ domain
MPEQHAAKDFIVNPLCAIFAAPILSPMKLDSKYFDSIRSKGAGRSEPTADSDKLGRDKATRDKAVRDKAGREKSARDKAGRDAAAAREQDTREDGPRCQWAGCEDAGTHPAPMGRGHEGRYFKFCLAHVQAYNKSYNYFQGMSDVAVEAFQRDAATGHRPTWKVGESGSGAEQDMKLQRARERFTKGARFSMFDGDAEETPRAQNKTSNPIIGNMARKSLDQLSLQPGAAKDEIKKRFKELVKRHHPDVNGGDKRSEERLREIISAYNYLKQAGFC